MEQKTVFHVRRFGALLKRKRLKKKKTIEEAAASIGVTPRLWTMIENGKKMPDINTYLLIERWAKISVFETMEYVLYK